MVFSSIEFGVFFIIVCTLMLITNIRCIQVRLGKKAKSIRHMILLAASYFFYGWWDWRFLILMIGLTWIAFFCSLQYSRTKKRLFAYISFVVPLVVLGFFKYFNFFADSFAAVFGIARMDALQIILPVGVSFYTFQSLSYSIDVYRGKIEAEESFTRLALYIAFFPQLVAGPIVKAADFLPQLQQERNISLKNLELGIQYFLFGLFKKIVIADQLSVCVDAVFRAPSQYHAVSLIMAVIAYSLQIYCDFSGYSDMAIGAAKCLGYDLERNFNIPYISRNVSEFWKRWHISLSTWLMEYLYIPLGGNRKGRCRTYINLFLTMLLGGLWHGANWTFVVWGALHGAALCIHKVWMTWRKLDKHHYGTFLGNAVSTAATYVFVSFCWVFFRAENFGIADKVIRGIVLWQDGIMYVSTWTILAILVIAIATMIPVLKAWRERKAPDGFYCVVSLGSIQGLTLFFIGWGLALILAYTGSSPFIYFQF